MECKADLDSLYLQLTQLLNEKVSLFNRAIHHSHFFDGFFFFFGFFILMVLFSFLIFLCLSRNVMSILITVMNTLIHLRNHYFGYLNGLILVTNMVLATNYVTTV